MNNNKQKTRAKAKYIRENLNVKFCSEKITEHVLTWGKFTSCKNIMLFYPKGSEFSLLDLLKDKTKSYFFPVVDGDNMYPVFYDENQGFKIGDFGVMEPVGVRISDYSLIDLIIIPALAVDMSGYRMGYGRGFYDRFLANLPPTCTKIVPIASELIFDNIPCESHDKKVDYLITEKGITEINC